MTISRLLLLAALIMLPLHSHAAAGLTYHGKITKPNGQPLEGASVDFHIQLKSPNAENCLLFDETQNLDMSGSGGLFVLTIGQGTRVAPGVDGGNSLDKIFSNRGSLTGLNCTVGNSYVKGTADGRKLIVQFNDGSGWQSLPTSAINFMPMSIESMQVAGYGKDQLLRVADGVTAAEMSGANWTALWDLITGTSTVYSKADGSNFNPTADVDFNGRKIIDLADPVAATDATNKQYVDGRVGGKAVDVNGVSNLAGDGRTLVWDQAQNKWVTGVALDSTKLPLAGGTMTGVIVMGGYSISNVGHVVVADQGTMYLGKFTAGQETTLLTTPPLNNTTDRGRTWFNVTTGKMRYWDGLAAHDVASKDYVDSAVATAQSAAVTTAQTYADGKLVSKNLAVPAAGQDQQSIKWDQTAGNWVYYTPSTSDATKLPLAGGTMTGNIVMSGNSITGLGSPSGANDAVRKVYADSNLLGLPLAAPGAGQVGQAVRWNAGNTAWEYYTPQAALGYTPVNKAGDTMLGILALSADPTANMDAATKQWVVSSIATAGGSFVTKDGLTALTADWDIDGAAGTGFRITGLSAPTVAADAVNKTYADARETAAKAYADTVSADALSDAEDYADTVSAAAQTAAIAAANTYSDGKLVTKNLAVPAVGQDGQSIRWNQTAGNWEYFTAGSGSGTVSQVTSANTDIGITNTTTTPLLTLNVGTGNNQIVKLNGSAELPAVSGVNLTTLNASNIASGTLADARLSANVALKAYVDAADLKLITKDLAQPLAGDDLKVIRWNQTAGNFEYFAVTNSGDGSAFTNLNASNISSGTLADARLSANVVLKSYADGKLVSKDLAVPTVAEDQKGIKWDQTAGNWVYYSLNSGDGSALTNLNASNIASGTLADARLSANVALKAYVDAGDAAERAYVDGKLVSKNLAVPAAGQDGQSVRWNNTSGNWEYFTAGSGSGTVSTVTSANTDIGITNNTTTPELTLNVGTGNNQIVKLNGSAELPAVSGVNLTNLNASNIASGTLADARLSSNVALKAYVDAADLKLITKDLAQPVAGDDMKVIRWNQTAGNFEYAAVNSGDGSALTNLNASNISSGTLADARLSANVALKSYVDANILGLPLAAPAAGQVGQSIRWNAGNTAWEYYTPTAAIADDSLNFDKFSDSLALDASTTITAPSGQAYGLKISNEGAGDSFRVDDANADASPFIIDASGNVGVGTSAPGAKLHVAGDIYSTNSITIAANAGSSAYSPTAIPAIGPAMQIGNDNATDGSGSQINIFARNSSSNIQRAFIGTASVVGAGNYSPVLFFHQQTGATTYAERMRIDTTGNIGIGTASPNQLLTVEGVTSLRETAAPSSTANYGKVYVKSADSKLYFMDDSGAEVQLGASGVAGIGADTVDFTELKDSLALDASTTITAPSGQAYSLLISNEGTGDSFRVNDASGDTTPFVVDADGKVGIGVATPLHRAHIEGPLLVTGDWGSGDNLNISGAGTRMFFYPKKAAFRAGFAGADQFDDVNIGDASFAVGSNALASKVNSIAMGSYASATGDGAIAFAESESSGLWSFSNGSSEATGMYSNALGSSYAQGNYSVAMGSSSEAIGNYTVAMGSGSYANGVYTVAGGHGVVADAHSSIALGSYNVGGGTNGTWVATEPIFEIGNGVNSGSRSNALTILKNGKTGIGAVAPNELLTVEGVTSLRETTAPSNTANYGKIYVKSADSKLYFKDDSGAEIQLGAAGVAGIAADTVDFTELKDSLALDASTTITAPSGQAYSLRISNEGTGDSFRVDDANADTSPFIIDASGKVGVGVAVPTNQMSVGNTTFSYQAGFDGIDIANSASNSILKVGQDSTHQIQFRWDYNATAANASGNLVTYGYANPMFVDASKLVLQSNGPGGVGVGVTAPTAGLHLKAGAAAANSAPLKLTAGTNLTAPEAGAIEYDGTNMYFTDSTNARRTIAAVGATGVGDFMKNGSVAMTGNFQLGSNYISNSGASEGLLVSSSGDVTVSSSSATVYTPSSTSSTAPGGTELKINNTNGTTNTMAKIEFKNSGSQRAYIGSLKPASGNTPAIVIGQQTGATAYDERVRIDASGNVGIGTTSPGQKLTVAGTIESTSGGVKFPDGTTQTTASAPYVMGGTFVGTLAASQVLMQHPFPIAVTIPINCTNSRFEFATAATASTTITMSKCTGAGFSSCTAIGTAVVGAGQKVASFTCAAATSFTAGTDSLLITGPASADTTAATAGWAIYGTR